MSTEKIEEKFDEENVDLNNSNDESCDEILSFNSSQVDTSNEASTEPPMEQQSISAFEKKQKIVKQLYFVGRCLLFVFVGVLFLLGLSNIYQQTVNIENHCGFFGIGNAVVASDSMEPKLYKNDLIFYKQVDPSKIEVDDTIVYKRTTDTGDMLIVHNVIQKENGYIITQGINNAMPDEAFAESNVVGKHLFKIPKIGGFLSLFSTKWAPVLVVVIFLIFFALKTGFFIIAKQKHLNDISKDKETQEAIKTFFDI